MNEAAVTQLWMAGVIATMLVFAVAALIGYLRARLRAPSERE